METQDMNYLKLLEKLKSLAPTVAGAATVAGVSALSPDEAASWPRREIADILRTLAKKGKEFEFLKSLGFPKEMSRHI